VLIVDACPVVRYGLRHIVGLQCQCDPIGECYGLGALDQVRAHRWSRVILGISIPDGGLELLRDILQAAQSTKVVLLSSLPEPEYALKALDAGAFGYLTKQDSVPELVLGFRTAFSGRIYVSSAVDQAVGSSGNLPHETLSEREYSVFLGISSGKRLSRLAEDLNVNTKTISTYRRRILEKMRMDSNADLVAYALRHIPHAETARGSGWDGIPHH
jgi:two-component system invasion response regulator UvrY